MAQPSSSPQPVPVLSQAKSYKLQRLRLLTRLLDNAVEIPGTSYRIGLDPIIGLLPAGGDIVSSILSAYIVLEAARLGLPNSALLRMVVNIILDTVAGTVPILGDLFDVTWKANSMNLELIEAHIQTPQSSQKANKWFVFLLLVGLTVIVMGISAASIAIIRLVFKAFLG